ncbi:hypothetical protein WJX84_008685 [Apatococcus fuscideae]|uniref:Uncharacterized protein n=1 Tax=Apatococcus fuscideae TaxID=2026836 RepID=A0AAW1TGP1_9CHLO
MACFGVHTTSHHANSSGAACNPGPRGDRIQGPLELAPGLHLNRAQGESRSDAPRSHVEAAQDKARQMSAGMLAEMRVPSPVPLWPPQHTV